MNSAIGNYVHLSYTGYVKGPQLGSGKPPFFESYASALSNRENHFNQWVQSQENKAIKILEKEIQKSLDLLKSFKENKGNISQVESNEMAMALLDDLWDELDLKYLNLDRIAAAASGLIDSGGFGSGSNIGNKTFRQQATTGNINNQINQYLNTFLNEINNSINQIAADQNLNINKIESALAKTKNNINSFFSKLEQQGKKINTSNQKRTANQINKIFSSLKTAIQSDLVINNTINIEKLLNELSFGLSAGMTSNQYKGDISEALISVMAKRLAGVTLDKLDTTIRDAVVTGQQRSSRGIDTAYFVSNVDWKQVLKNEKINASFGDFIASAEAVQDKVDVTITLEDGNNINISAKNYNPRLLEKGVINKSASFLSLIQNENQNDLINHYLNLNSVIGKGRQSLNPNKEAINNFIRKITIAKLITGYDTITGGGGQTMTSANVFAVFNSDAYTVKLYNMKDVLDGVFNGGRYQKLFIPTNLYKFNIKTPDYSVRISNVLRQLNISVSYSLKESEYAIG